MKFEGTRIILYANKYQECICFYENVLNLKMMFATETLTCFEFGGSYLMVELDGEFNKEAKSDHNRMCLRMNVSNVQSLVDELRSKDVEVDYQEHSWGTVAKFFDPDGNLCAFKDSEKFEKQIQLI